MPLANLTRCLSTLDLRGSGGSCATPSINYELKYWNIMSFPGLNNSKKLEEFQLRPFIGFSPTIFIFHQNKSEMQSRAKMFYCLLLIIKRWLRSEMVQRWAEWYNIFCIEIFEALDEKSILIERTQINEWGKLSEIEKNEKLMKMNPLSMKLWEAG